MNWPQWLVVLITNGIGGGIQVVATFIPIVGFLFMFCRAGRLRLHGQGGFRDGSVHAHDRLARQILRADDSRFRLQRTGDYGDADAGSQRIGY